MNERLRALLDDAVSDLEPVNPDPVPAIVARGRAARRRTVVAGALATVLLAGLAVAAGPRVTDSAGPVSPAAAQPPTPYVVGRTVVAGDVTVPIPQGWRVVVGSPNAPCGKLKNTVLIYGADAAHCQYAPIEVSGMPKMYVSGRGVYAGQTMVDFPPSPYTLRGGAPAWLAEPVTDESNVPKGAGYSYTNTMIVPWSKVMVLFAVPGPQQQQIIDSISVTPSPRPGRLLFQDNVSSASLVRPTAGGAEPDYGTVNGASRIDALLRLLRAQHKTVDSRHACTSPELPAARLTLESIDPVQPPSLPATPSANGRGRVISVTETTVIISLGDCREAVSSSGGRVGLSQDTVDALAHLFGIVTR
jgi:hypothetical protein